MSLKTLYEPDLHSEKVTRMHTKCVFLSAVIISTSDCLDSRRHLDGPDDELPDDFTESPIFRHGVQGGQRVDSDHQERQAVGQGLVHVPNQHGSHEEHHRIPRSAR